MKKKEKIINEIPLINNADQLHSDIRRLFLSVRQKNVKIRCKQSTTPIGFINRDSDFFFCARIKPNWYRFRRGISPHIRILLSQTSAKRFVIIPCQRIRSQCFSEIIKVIAGNRVGIHIANEKIRQSQEKGERKHNTHSVMNRRVFELSDEFHRHSSRKERTRSWRWEQQERMKEAKMNLSSLLFVYIYSDV